jgi:DNA repair exonuclease SbcCD nuclease subunit
MARFLHLADIHLGTHQYQNAERNRDFFRSFWEVADRFAVPGEVDFVLVAGDLFDKRSIDAPTLSQATAVLKRLADRGIPVCGVEGNHDRAYYGEGSSWLEYLNSLGLLRLLRNEVAEDGSIILRPWEAGKPPGAYVDIGDIRVIGGRYYGASTPKAIEPMADAIKALPPAPFTVLMWHLGIEGFVSALAGGVSMAQIEPLRQCTDYLALGHVHQRYEIDDWLYNPGPLEPCNITEASLPHGALMVTVEPNGHTTEAIEEYARRPFCRVPFDLTPFESPADFQDALPAFLEKHLGQAFAMAPIVELTLTGTCRFSRSALDLDWVRQMVVTSCAPLVVLLRNVTSDGKLAIAPDAQHHLDRDDLERLILQDCFAQDARYRPTADRCGHVLLELKNRLENGEKPPSLVKFLKEAVPLALQPASEPEPAAPEADVAPADLEVVSEAPPVDVPETAPPEPVLADSEAVPEPVVADSEAPPEPVLADSEAVPEPVVADSEVVPEPVVAVYEPEPEPELPTAAEPEIMATEAVTADSPDAATPDSGQLTLF